MPKTQGGGFDKLRKTIEELSKHQAKTGWPEDATYEDGTKVVDVAGFHEFGNPKLPKRSFIRVAIANNGNKWKQSFLDGIKASVSGSVSPVTVLENTALMAAGDIAKAIKAVSSPPLNKKTIDQKGFDKPLVDTGLLFQSVTGIVEPKE